MSSYNGRDDRIRTCDPLVPSEVRYQAALHPDKLLNCYFDLVSHLRCYLSSRTISSLLGRVNLPTSTILDCLLTWFHTRCYLSSRTISSLLGRVNLPTSNIGLSFGISTISYATDPHDINKIKILKISYLNFINNISCRQVFLCNFCFNRKFLNFYFV